MYRTKLISAKSRRWSSRKLNNTGAPCCFWRKGLMSRDVERKAGSAIAGSVSPLALCLFRIWHSLVTTSGGKTLCQRKPRLLLAPRPNACTLRLAFAETVWTTASKLILFRRQFGQRRRRVFFCVTYFVSYVCLPVCCFVVLLHKAFCWICLNIQRKHPDRFLFFFPRDTSKFFFSLPAVRGGQIKTNKHDFSDMFR